MEYANTRYGCKHLSDMGSCICMVPMLDGDSTFPPTEIYLFITEVRVDAFHKHSNLLYYWIIAHFQKRYSIFEVYSLVKYAYREVATRPEGTRGS